MSLDIEKYYMDENVGGVGDRKERRPLG